MNKEQTYQPPEIVTTADGSHTLKSNRFKATYHSVNGAVDESNYVFIENGLLRRLNMEPQQELSILELGFGSGLNAWLTLLKSNELNCVIRYHTVEAFPVRPEQASLLNYSADNLKHRELFMQLHSCEWHKEHLLTDRFYFTKYHQLFENFETDRCFDLIYFDAFSPGEQPELWTPEILSKVSRLLHNGGLLVTYCAQGQMKRDMRMLGLDVKALKGATGKREMTIATKPKAHKKS